MWPDREIQRRTNRTKPVLYSMVQLVVAILYFQNYYPTLLQRETTAEVSFLLPWMIQPFQNGSTHKGKNLLLGEQILSF